MWQDNVIVFGNFRILPLRYKEVKLFQLYPPLQTQNYQLKFSMKKQKNKYLERWKKGEHWDVDSAILTSTFQERSVFLSSLFTSKSIFGSYGKSIIWFEDQKQIKFALFLLNEFDFFSQLRRCLKISKK